MSLYGVMRTSVSGMNAQAGRLSVVAENVANVSTTGYKRSSSEFSSLLLNNSSGVYESGSVTVTVRGHAGAQGSMVNTASVTDLAIGGEGFFLVSDADGKVVLTRAGSFTADGSGELVNAAGFNLMAYRLGAGPPEITANGFTGLEPLNLESLALTASASMEGTFTANLPADAAEVLSSQLPSANSASSAYTAKSSLITFDSLGREVPVDLYFSKTSDNEWEVAAFLKSASAPGGAFPYTSGPLAVASLTFDPSTGALDASSAAPIDMAIPGGETVSLDLGATTQLAADYVVVAAKVDGNAPSGADLVDITRDGFVYATYDNGTRVPVYRIPLAHVISPDMLTPLAGNVYMTSPESGDVQIGFGQSGGLGDVISNALEQSTVDLADELTSMIDAQRSYSANSKVFQTGSELMDVLVNLKR